MKVLNIGIGKFKRNIAGEKTDFSHITTDSNILRDDVDLSGNDSFLSNLPRSNRQKITNFIKFCRDNIVGSTIRDLKGSNIY